MQRLLFVRLSTSMLNDHNCLGSERQNFPRSRPQPLQFLV